MMKKILLLIIAGALLPSAVWAKPYKNYLPQKQWAKYGVNPWTIDTDNDGYDDSYEIKFGFCPTSPEAIKLTDIECEKGKINLTKGTYVPPSVIAQARPILNKFSSCAALNNWVVNTNNQVIERKSEMAAYLATFQTSTIGSSALALINKKAEKYLASINSESLSKGTMGNNQVFSSDGKRYYEINNDSNTLTVFDAATNQSLGQAKFSPFYTLPQVAIYKNKIILAGSINVASNDAGDSSANQEAAVDLRASIQVWQFNNPKYPKLETSLLLSEPTVQTGVVIGKYYYTYLYSQLFTNLDTGDAYDQFITIPKMALVKNNKVGAYKEVAKCGDILYPVLNTASGWPLRFVHLVAVPLEGNAAVGHRIVYGVGQEVKFAGDDLFLTRLTGGNNLYATDLTDEATEFYKFNLDKNNFVPAETQSLPGFLQGGLNTQDQYLRAFTERNSLVLDNNSQDYYLTILDKDLNKRGWYNSIIWGKEFDSIQNTATEMRVFTNGDSNRYFKIDLTTPNRPVPKGEVSE